MKRNLVVIVWNCLITMSVNFCAKSLDDVVERGASVLIEEGKVRSLTAKQFYTDDMNETLQETLYQLAIC